MIGTKEIVVDIKTLEVLGINAEDLGERIVDQAVHALLNSSGFNGDTEEEVTYESQFKREVNSRIKNAVDEKIAALASVHIVPRVGELIEKADMRKTNGYGEPTSPPMTFKEYIAYRAELYMSEDVDISGKSKIDLEARNESTYNFRSVGPRLTVLMRLYIKDEMEKAAKDAVSEVNKVIAKNIAKAAADAIASTANSLRVSVST